MDFEDESFDFVWSWGVIHHTPNTSAVIEKIYKLLVPGGQFYMMIYRRFSFHHLYKILLINGILKRLLLNMSHQQLLNYCSDRHVPLAQYFSRRQTAKMLELFSKVKFQTYEPRQMIVGYLPQNLRNMFDNHFPERLMKFVFSSYGHLLFGKAVK